MEAPAPVQARFTTADVVLPDGIRLRIVDGGRTDGPAVIFLHGITDSSFSFSRVLPLMPAHYRLIALDQRGHGESDKPERGYEMDDFARDVIGVMDTLQIATATLVGHSMGTFVARGVAERAPERVTRLVLIGAAWTFRNAIAAEIRQASHALRDPVDETFIREFQVSTLARPVPPEFLERVIQESQKLPARVWRAAFDGLWNFEPGRRLTCPTTIIGGDLDAIFSVEEQKALSAAVERSTLHLERGIGHTLHWEAPERFIELAF